MRRVPYAETSQRRVDALVASLASRQHGLISREQIASMGGTKDLIRHRVNTGRWEAVERGVFVVAGAPCTWRRSVMAACLAWGNGAVVSHRTAASLWRLEGFRTKIIELTIPRGRQRQGPGIVYRRVLLPGDVTTIDDLPVTTLPRTLIDLAAVVSRDQLEEALDDASRRGLVTMARLRSRLDRYGRGRHGVGILRALLDERDHSARPLGSALERKALRMFRAERLPEPIPQFRVRSGNRLIATVDFAYPELLLGIEVDGYRWHTGRKRFVEDRRRLNALTSLGWRIIHVVWEDLQHGRPDAIDTIRRSIASRGEEL